MAQTLSQTRHVAPLSFSRVIGFVSTRIELQRSRRALAALDPSRLADIGVSEAAAAQEASRTLWDAPHFWKA